MPYILPSKNLARPRNELMKSQL